MKRTLGLACALGLTLSPQLSAATIPIDDARIRIELNATDEDVGIQLFLDADGWRRIKVFDPNGRKIVDLTAQGSVGTLGITELFFESEEPSLDDLPLDEFLALFPKGKYRIFGETAEGDKLFGKAKLTHALPEAPELVTPAEAAAVDPANTVIAWNPVADPPGSEIVLYEVIVERDDEVLIFDVKLPATIHSVTVPAEFMEPGTAYKVEVLAIESGGNQTITEREFSTQG